MIGVRNPMPGVVYPPEHELRKYVENGVLTLETIPGALVRSFSQHSERIALKGTFGQISYRELDELTNRAAAGFARLGLKPMDRVVFQMHNGPDLLISLIASFKAGLIPVCTLVTHRESEIGYLAEHSGAKAHFIDGARGKFDFVAFALNMQKQVKNLQHVIAGGDLTPSKLLGVTRLTDLIASEQAYTASQSVQDIVSSLDPFQAAVFQLSGGTTGVPKIIPRFHNEYLYNMHSVFARMERTGDETVFCAGPMIHNAGMVCHWGPTLLNGGSVVTDRDLTVDGLKNILTRFRPTWLFLMRPLLIRLSEAIKDGDVDVSFVKAAITSSNAHSVRGELGMPGFHFFGMAEGLIMSNRERDLLDAICQGVGQPVSSLDQIRLVKPGTEIDVELGETGELICKGPYTIHGYYRAEERNREAFTSDGFYRSGDLLSLKRFGDEFHYVFEGRLKDVVNRGGEKINCDEVERALRGFDGLMDVAVVAMPDDVYIEKACAFLCLAHGYPIPTVGHLGAYLETKGLAKYKWPERVEVIDSLPTTKAGKISKAVLRQWIEEKLAMEKAETFAPRLHGVHHTARPTWKLAETIEFYRDRLGLPLLHVISAKGWGREGHPDFLHFFFDSGNGSTIAFFYYLGTDQPEYLRARTEEVFYRATHTAWRVECRGDLVAWKEKLEAVGIEVSTYTQHEVIESIYFTDPNGYPLEITVHTRTFNDKDARDASLSLDAALQAEKEAAAQGRRIRSIEEVWQRKGTLVASSAPSAKESV